MSYHYEPSPFMLPTSHYDEAKADRAVTFINNLSHTKGKWAGKRFDLLPWQEQIVRDLFGIVKEDGNRQFLTAYIEIPKKNGKSELAAAIALLMTCGDNEWGAEVYGCASDRQQASIVFDVAVEGECNCASDCKIKTCTRNLNNKFFRNLQKKEEYPRFSFQDFSKDCYSYKE